MVLVEPTLDGKCLKNIVQKKEIHINSYQLKSILVVINIARQNAPFGKRPLTARHLDQATLLV